MNIELRDENEVVLGKGSLPFEATASIQSGDLLKLEDDRFNVKGTFALLMKMCKVHAGQGYCPTFVFYVIPMEDQP
jgi:hypothetical protein